MSRYVIDASVAIKWYLPEIHDAPAKCLLTGNQELLVPDLIFSEVGNILWKRVRAGQMSAEEALEILKSFDALGLTVITSSSLILSALTIACQTQRTVYDSLYLALAVRKKSVMITADERFYNALQTSHLAPFIVWVENIPDLLKSKNN